MRIRRPDSPRRPFLAGTPRSFAVFLLVRLSLAIAIVVLAVASLLGFASFAGSGGDAGAGPGRAIDGPPSMAATWTEVAP